MEDREQTKAAENEFSSLQNRHGDKVGLQECKRCAPTILVPHQPSVTCVIRHVVKGVTVFCLVKSLNYLLAHPRRGPDPVALSRKEQQRTMRSLYRNGRLLHGDLVLQCLPCFVTQPQGQERPPV